MKPSSGAWRLAAGLAALAAAALVAAPGCGKKQQAGFPPVPVQAAKAVAMDVPREIDVIGTVEAYNTVSVVALVGGRLLAAPFREGQEVKRGDLLFRIDPAPFEAALGEARANLERDRAKLADAEADLARYAELVAKDYVTRQEYDAYAAAAAAAKATVEADESTVETARLNLEYCTIRSPIDGRTGDLLVKIGNIVKANGDALVTINQIVPVNVSFTIPETGLPDVRRYSAQGTLSVHVHIPPDTTRTFDGKLTFIDNTVDETTGTILLKGTFPNGDRALWPGQYARVNLVLTTIPNAVVIPAAAVQTSQQGDYVYVIGKNDAAELRTVVEGPRFEDKVVVTKGVAAGETVVTDGQLRLMPGAKVAVTSGLAPGGPGAPAAPSAADPGGRKGPAPEPSKERKAR